MAVWSPQEETLIRDNLSSSTKEIYLAFCDAYGSTRSYDSVQKKIKQIREEALDSGMIGQPVEPPEEDGIEDAFTSLLGATPVPPLVIPGATALQKKEDKERIKEWLEELVEYGNSLNFQISSRARVSEGTSLCVAISDVHVGKHTDDFSLEVAKERLLTIPTRLFTREHTADITEVVIMLIGDLVEGEDIYPTQSSHIQCSAIEQVQRCIEALWEMILSFRSLFNCRVTIHSVPGNHGRVSRTANEKTNWDNVVYYILQTMVATHSDKDIVFTANYNQFHTFRVQDKVGMIYHYGVRHTGTPAMREKVAGWSSARNFDFMCHGHWHEWHVGAWLGKPVIGNGCICGPDDLAERMAREDTAKQAYFKVKEGEPLYGFGWLEW